MMKRILFLAVLLAGFVLPSNAVLKEDSLKMTLSILRQELIKYHDEYSARQAQTKNSRMRVIATIMQETDRANQNALMLYSQKDGYVFDLTYACHEATKQYKDLEKKLEAAICFQHTLDSVKYVDIPKITVIKTMGGHEIPAKYVQLI
jgi:F0F1-type ATP synthase delta subunit